ncbi:PEP-CTERM/exosortase system-associated acyltransferase [Massilia sp. DJPM01]|uniref:PEP-CTERM/exosortase system-associated acyltransferase n=1 Tax=Massilia sp. DJPM01 TaxID=3024404 RepID=UPI00259EDD40|nr:PEP-CTERM/exosortase system-associated acyltransferase [Massilia sp. DJPM01]MDM5178066.1 PEP-CTERM/exosortase system-associated acyltransferase [Massilia sp. DJPM01]
MLLLFQRLFGRRDLLIPYVDFTTIPPGAHASPLLSRIYRMRYQVYCLECRFLDAAAYPDGIESDGWDANSAHVAANSLDGDLIGTVRLVRPQPGRAFPFQAQCPVYEGVVLPPRGESAEVSRLIVEKALRRRSGDAMEGMSSDVVENRNSSGRRRFSRQKSDRRNSPGAAHRRGCAGCAFSGPVPWPRRYRQRRRTGGSGYARRPYRRPPARRS